jgi:hypothetical protein
LRDPLDVLLQRDDRNGFGDLRSAQARITGR